MQQQLALILNWHTDEDAIEKGKVANFTKELGLALNVVKLKKMIHVANPKSLG